MWRGRGSPPRQAEQTANQAKVAAAAYETAFAETVPPPVIAANRSLLMALVATNIFGQNTPAIATTEAQYGEMWAQDAAAMYGYAGSSAFATALTPFTSPQQSTNQDGPANQSAVVAHATGNSAGNAKSIVSSAQQTFSAVPNALTNLADPAADPPLTPLDLINLAGNLSGIFVDPEIGAAGLGLGAVSLPYDVVGALTGFHTDDIVSGWAGVEPWPGTAPVPPTLVSGDHKPGRIRGVGGHGRGEHGRRFVGAAGLGCGGPGDTPGRAGIAGHQPGRRRGSLLRQRRQLVR